jgi:NAD(P)H dehydrogenase (quinone)
MILVTGAAGKTGKAVIRAVAARGGEVRALVRRTAQAAEVVAAGACEAAVGAFDDPAALAHAASGATAIYHICPNVSPHEMSYAKAVVAAATAAGVRRFVYHSVLHPQIEAMPHHWAKLRVEEMLLASGLDVTVLQPTAYMQNVLAGWRSIAEQGVYRVPYPVETRISLVDLRDVAAAAALVLTEPGHAGATYALVGTMRAKVAACCASSAGPLRKRSGEIIRPENCSKVWVKTRWLRSRVRVTVRPPRHRGPRLWHVGKCPGSPPRP